MKRGPFFLLFILVVGFVSPAQRLHLPFSGSNDGSNLSFNLDRLWAYNLYEHSRWGVGFDYNHPFSNSNSIELSGYVGYGVQDRQFKGGLGVVYETKRNAYYLKASRDYSAAANRRMEATQLQDISNLSGFMSSRMSDNISVILGYQRKWGSTSLIADANLFYGGRLFDGSGLLYRCNGDVITPENGLELKILFSYKKNLKTKVVVGHTWPSGKPIASLLMQYSRSLSSEHFRTDFFVQGGITPRDVPYIRMFDLGGTFGAPVWFRNVLQTIQPYEYTANAFVLLSLRSGFKEPIFDIYSNLLVLGSRPRPFVGLSAAWGHLWGQDATGFLYYEGLNLIAPSEGLLEATAGIDGLVRWGAVDYGVATSVGLIPRRSTTRWAILLTAEFSL
ncbi:MAG: hypothetical protein K6A94_04980 [Bacteroidales bacterium]|nr:hypothetical protein [Bacteroidales bacterium]